MSGLMALLAPIAALALNVVCQVTICHLVPRAALLRSLVLGFGLGAAFLLLYHTAAWVLGGQPLAQAVGLLLANLVIYGALGYCYFHFVNLGETARRIRLVRELHQAPAGLTYPEILRRYNAAQITDLRMQRLLKTRQVVLRQGRYFIDRPLFLVISRLMVALKVVVLGKRSEFD